MQLARVMKHVLGVEQVVIEDVAVQDTVSGDVAVVVTVRLWARQAGRCGVCRGRCSGYEQGDGMRRWRALDAGTMRVFVQAAAPRVACPEHGVVVAAVPWARHGSGFTSAFEEQVAWLTARTAKTTVEQVMRVSWRTITAMVERVVAQTRQGTDRLAGLRRIAIDEKSYRRGHTYLTVVTDHDSGRVVWAAPGRSKETLARFFTDLGPERAADLEHISADGAEWIHSVVDEHAPNAVVCLDPFHVVQWANEAVDSVRRGAWRALRGEGRKGDASEIKGSRWALLKKPGDLTGNQQATLAQVKTVNGPLFRAYLIKEQLREVFAVGGQDGHVLLAGVISWGSRSRIPEMIDLARKLRKFQALIRHSLDSGVSNARAEATNTHIQGLIRRAYGFRTPEALIAMIELTRGGLCPPLPGRS